MQNPARPVALRLRGAISALCCALAGAAACAAETVNPETAAVAETATAPATGAAAENPAASLDLPALAERSAGAFVFIAGGSGALISADGVVVTNSHVVGQGTSFGVSLGDGRTFRADVVGRDQRGDLALLRIVGARDLPYYRLGDSANLRLGEPCLAIGNPLSLGMDDRRPSFSLGVVSALHQFRQGYNDAIVTDAPINPGNSGGPLLNARGELVGITGMTQVRIGMKSNSGVGYAIPADQIRIWLPFLLAAEGGNVFHGRLPGLELAENDGKVLVRACGDVPAAHGFAVGDQIVSLMGREILSIPRFNSIQGIYPAGWSMTAVIRRGGEEVPLRFNLPALRPWRQAFTLARPQPKEEYPRVAAVVAESAAERAGLRTGDLIASIDGKPARAEAISGVARHFAELCAGDRVELLIVRDNQRQTLSFTAE